MASMAKNDYHEIAKKIMAEEAMPEGGDMAMMMKYGPSGSVKKDANGKPIPLSDESGEPVGLQDESGEYVEGDESGATAYGIEQLWQRFDANEELTPEEYKVLIQNARDIGSEVSEDNARLRSDPQAFMNSVLENATPEEVAYLQSLSPEEQQALMQQIADSDGLGGIISFMPKK